MNTLRKLSKTFYQVSKVLLIIGIVFWALFAVINLIIGAIGLVAALAMSAGAQQDEAMALAITSLVLYPIMSVGGLVFDILALVFTKKARGSNEVKAHILAAVFGFISGWGEFSTAAGIIGTIYLKKGGKMDESDTGDFAFVEKAQAKVQKKAEEEPVEAKPVEEEKPAEEPKAE